MVTDYIKFCEDMIVPSKIIKIFTNYKPWITKKLKSTINEKKIAFISGKNMIQQKIIQAKLNKESSTEGV